jgi:hypothetical protein
MPAVMIVEVIRLIVERLRVPVMMAAIAMPARRPAVMMAARLYGVRFNGRSRDTGCDARICGRRGDCETDCAGGSQSEKQVSHFSFFLRPHRPGERFRFGKKAGAQTRLVRAPVIETLNGSGLIPPERIPGAVTAVATPARRMAAMPAAALHFHRTGIDERRLQSGEETGRGRSRYRKSDRARGSGRKKYRPQHGYSSRELFAAKVRGLAVARRIVEMN